MADMDKYADEMLSDDELDNVVGGTFEESLNDGAFFRDKIFDGRCILSSNTSHCQCF